MNEFDEIVKIAKTKESWSASGKYNYGPINYLNEKVLNMDFIDENGKRSWKKFEELFDKYESLVHRVTDWRTFLAYEFCKFDCIVDVTQLVCTMKRTFPKISSKSVCKWINENRESHHVLN